MKKLALLILVIAANSAQAGSIAIDPPKDLYCLSDGKKVPASFAEKRETGHIVFVCNQTQQEIFDELNTYAECDYQLGWSDGKSKPRYLLRIGPAQPCPALSFSREAGLKLTHPDMNSMEGDDLNPASLQPGATDVIECAKTCRIKACSKDGKKCKLSDSRGTP
jgi:hypothetical protein